MREMIQPHKAKMVNYGHTKGLVVGAIPKMQSNSSTIEPVVSWRWPCWALI